MVSQFLLISNLLNDKFADDFDTGLMGKNAKENAQCDEISLVVQELLEVMVPAYYQDDEEVKKAAWKRLEEKEYPRIFGELEKRLVANGGEFMVGKQLTYADFIMVWIITGMKEYVPCTAAFIDEKYPTMNKLCDRVVALPAIANYIKNRPVTDR